MIAKPKRKTKYSRRKRWPEFMRFVRNKPCLVCERHYGLIQEYVTEAAHTGLSGMAMKSDDRTTIPLCTFHHLTGAYSIHRQGQERFFLWWRINREAEIKRLNAEYAAIDSKFEPLILEEEA